MFFFHCESSFGTFIINYNDVIDHRISFFILLLTLTKTTSPVRTAIVVGIVTIIIVAFVVIEIVISTTSVLSLGAVISEFSGWVTYETNN